MSKTLLTLSKIPEYFHNPERVTTFSINTLIFIDSLLAVFWSIFSLTKIYKEETTNAKTHFTAIVEDKKKQRSKKQNEKKSEKIAKLKYKIEKMESDE